MYVRLWWAQNDCDRNSVWGNAPRLNSREDPHIRVPRWEQSNQTVDPRINQSRHSQAVTVRIGN